MIISYYNSIIQEMLFICFSILKPPYIASQDEKGCILAPVFMLATGKSYIVNEITT